MRVGVDLDGVLAAMDLIWFDRYNQTHKQNLTRAMIRDWDFDGANLVIPEREFYALRTPDIYLEVQPIDGALDGIHFLDSEGYNPIIITADSKGFTEAKQQWLFRHGFSHLECVVERDKAKACREHGVDLLIDDAPHNAIEVATSGVDVLLYDHNGEYSYNQNEKYVYPENVLRVTSWYQIQCHLLRLDMGMDLHGIVARAKERINALRDTAGVGSAV